MVLLRSDALLIVNDRANAEAVQKVRALVRAGEDHYMGFQFVPAAAALSDAAAQLLDVIGQLDAEQLKLLRRALLLEGSSWAEAKRADLAVAAFVELLLRAGGAAVDMSLVSPKAQPYWQQAVNRVRARGVSTVALESEPTGADVFLDGEPRGRTPLLLSQVPLGAHHLSLRYTGYDAVQQNLQVVSETPRQRFLMAERPAIVALKRVRHAASHGGALDEAMQNELRSMSVAANAQAVVVVGVTGGDGARLVLQRFGRGGVLTHTVAVAVENMEAVLPQAVDLLMGPSTAPVGLPSEALNGLDFSRGLLGQSPNARVAAPALRVDLGEDSTWVHGPWQSVSLWGGAGTPTFSGFGPEIRAALSSSWGGEVFLFDAQADYAFSQQPNISSLNDVGLSVGVRARGHVWRIQLGGGLFAGGELAMQRAPSAFSGLRLQIAPHAGAQVRLDIEVAPRVFLGLTGYGRVQPLRVQEATGVEWQFPLQFGGLLGVGWLL